MNTNCDQKELCHLWFNSNFVDETGILMFKKTEIDKLQSDTKHKKVPIDFSVEFNLTEVNNEIQDVIQQALRLHYEPPFTNF